MNGQEYLKFPEEEIIRPPFALENFVVLSTSYEEINQEIIYFAYLLWLDNKEELFSNFDKIINSLAEKFKIEPKMWFIDIREKTIVHILNWLNPN